MPVARAARRAITPAPGISLCQAGSATIRSMAGPSPSGGLLLRGSIAACLLGLWRPFPLPARLPFGGIALIIRADDARDQGMPHHVPLVEAHHADSLDAFQRIQRIAQARAHARRQIDLAQVAG